MPSSSFSEKAFYGQAVTAADWMLHLEAAHSADPGMCPHEFALFRDGQGRHSYEFLAQSLAAYAGQDITAVDLACGDGYMIPFCLSHLGAGSRVYGIDMSAAELALAKAAITDPRVRFLQSDARALPLASASVDALLCHMAFMLMVPIEAVVAEIGRVLKPGGIAVLGFSVTNGQENRHRIEQVRKGFFQKEFPQFHHAGVMDARLYAPNGMASFFSPATGFAGIESVEDYHGYARIHLSQLWEILRSYYYTSALPEPHYTKLREETLAAAAPLADAEGLLLWDFSVTKFVIRK